MTDHKIVMIHWFSVRKINRMPEMEVDSALIFVLIGSYSIVIFVKTSCYRDPVKDVALSCGSRSHKSLSGSMGSQNLHCERF